MAESMRQEFLNDVKKTDDKAILFFAGYGQDPTPFVELAKEIPVFMVYDYDEDLSFNQDKLKQFSEIKLIAWSIGVMMAGIVLENCSLNSRIVKSIAVNGTCDGIAIDEDEIGLKAQLWLNTAQNLDENGRLNFIENMLLNKGNEHYRANLPKRDCASLKQELYALLKLKQEHMYFKRYEFSEAIIAKRDKIFPPSCVRACFSHIAYKSGPWAHYDDKLFSELFLNF